MATIKLNAQELKERVLPFLDKGKKGLKEASSILNSITIPKTFTSGELIKKIGHEISQESIRTITMIRGWTEEVSRKYEDAEKKSVEIMASLSLGLKAEKASDSNKNGKAKAKKTTTKSTGKATKTKNKVAKTTTKSTRKATKTTTAQKKKKMNGGFFSSGTKVFSRIGALNKSVTSTGAKIGQTIRSGISSFVNNARRNITNTRTNISQITRSRISSFVNNARRNITNTRTKIGQIATSRISSFVNNARRNITNTRAKIGQIVRSRVSSFVNNTRRNITNTRAKIGHVVRSGVSKIANVTRKITSTGAKIIKTGVSKVGKKVTGIASKLIGKRNIKVGGKIGKKVNSAISKVSKRVNKVIRNGNARNEINVNSDKLVEDAKNVTKKNKIKVQKVKVQKVKGGNAKVKGGGTKGKVKKNNKETSKEDKIMNQCKKLFKDAKINWKEEELFKGKEKDKISSLSEEIEKVLEKKTNVKHDGDEFRQYQANIYHMVKEKTGDAYIAADVTAMVFHNVVNKGRTYETLDNVDGTAIHALKGMNWNNSKVTVDGAKEMLNKLPTPLRKQVKQIFISDLPSPDDARMALYYKMPSYECSCRYIDGGTVCIFRSVNGEKLDLGVLAHEAGHGLDRTTEKVSANGTKTSISDGQEWRNAMKKDQKKGQQVGVSDYATQTINAQNSAEEDFSDSIRFYIEDKENFKKNYPNRYKILSDVLKEK